VSEFTKDSLQAEFIKKAQVMQKQRSPETFEKPRTPATELSFLVERGLKEWENEIVII
jgi:hypothetical protein